jgi:nitrite reductase (NADH) small subunit
MTEWIEIGVADDIPRQGARTIDSRYGKIAVFRTHDDQVFAVRNRCPHKNGPLAEGIVSGKTVACPLHNWVFDLESGQALAPDNGCTPTVPVKIIDGRLYLNPSVLAQVRHE